MTGFARQKKPVTSRIVKQVVADWGGKRRPGPFQLAAAAAAGLLLIIGLAWWSPLKEIIPLRGPSQAGARGAIIGSSKEKVSQEPKLERATPSIQPPLEEVATAFRQETNTFEKPKNLDDIQYGLFPQIITAREGDNLFRLTVKVYGDVNERLMEWVLINNPRIKNPSRIAVGQRIVFPDRPLDRESPRRGNLGSLPEKISEQTAPGSE
jgi:nucleoid-associated protein YgaU